MLFIKFYRRFLCYFVLEYEKLLDKAGVPTKLAFMKGAIHGFFSLPGNNINMKTLCK